MAEPAAAGKAAANSVIAKGDDRKAAEWVLSVGGQVVMLDRKKEVSCSKLADIPGGSPKLIRLGINSESRGNQVKSFTAEDTQCLNGLAELQAVFFNTKNIDFSSDHLAFLATCPNVTEVGLWYPKVDAGFLEHIVPLSKLRVLRFCYGKCAPLKLSRLHSRSLSEVSFQFTNFTDETVLELAAQTEMERLWLDQSSATDAGMAAVKGMKKLKGLGVENTKVTIEGLRGLAGLKLKALHFGSVNAADFAEAGRLFPSVDQFVMQRWGTHPDAAFLGLAATLPDLDHLAVYDAKFPDAALPSLAEFKKLTWLELVRSEFTDAAVPAVLRMKSLRRLTLEETRLTESGLSQLKSLKSLKTLNIRGITEIGDAAVKAFQKARPEVKVER